MKVLSGNLTKSGRCKVVRAIPDTGVVCVDMGGRLPDSTSGSSTAMTSTVSLKMKPEAANSPTLSMFACAAPATGLSWQRSGNSIQTRQKYDKKSAQVRPALADQEC
jgi:hypothetical protein